MPKKKILRDRKRSGYTYRQIAKLVRGGRALGIGAHEEALQLREAWLNNDITYVQAIREMRRIRKSQKRARERKR